MNRGFQRQRNPVLNRRIEQLTRDPPPYFKSTAPTARSDWELSNDKLFSAALYDFVTQPFKPKSDDATVPILEVKYFRMTDQGLSTTGNPRVFPESPSKYKPTVVPEGWIGTRWPPINGFLLPRPEHDFDMPLWQRNLYEFRQLKMRNDLTWSTVRVSGGGWWEIWNIFVRLGYTPLDWFEMELAMRLLKLHPEGTDSIIIRKLMLQLYELTWDIPFKLCVHTTRDTFVEKHFIVAFMNSLRGVLDQLDRWAKDIPVHKDFDDLQIAERKLLYAKK